MISFRARLEQHRQDVLVLLEEITRTATVHANPDVAGAVRALARAHSHLVEELRFSPAIEGSEGAAISDEDSTPIDGISGATRKAAK